MPGGKQSRQARHRPARAPEVPAPARHGSRRASPKVLLGAAVVAVIAGVAIVLAVSLGGGSSSSSTTVPAIGRLEGGLPGSADVQRLFKGIPQQAALLGEPKAPVTMTEYVDLQCPYCREFETVVLPRLVSGYVRTGKLRIDMRLLAFIGPDSVRGRSAALAAGEQNRQFNFSELLFFNQGTENTGWLDQQMVESAAASIPGLRVQAMLTAQSSPAVREQATMIDAAASAAGVTGTPTIYVGKTGARPARVELASPTDLASVTAAIDAALT
jgi:protein-disulfide isomerase